jgi:outer membrane immunogenic protein
MRRIIEAGLGVLALAVTMQVAAAADMPVKAPLYKAPVVVPFSWSGFYLGANGGYSWGRANTSLTETTTTTTTATITTLTGTPLASATVVGTPVVFQGIDRAKMNGGLGGLQAGYNWQVNNWVWGIEGDFQGTGERGGSTFCFRLTTEPCGIATGTADYKLRWLGTLRGRAGVAWDRVLVYATGGLAVGQIHADYTDGVAAGLLTPATVVVGSHNVTRAGWVIGAGIESALGDNWSVKVEYLHVDLGSFGGVVNGTTPTGAFSLPFFTSITTITQSTAFSSVYSTRFTDDIVRIGLNYRFGGPVVARY